MVELDRKMGSAQCQVEDVNGAGLRLLVETLHLLLPQTNIPQQNDWTWKPTQGTKHRIDSVGIAETVQPKYTLVLPLTTFCLAAGMSKIIVQFSRLPMSTGQRFVIVNSLRKSQSKARSNNGGRQRPCYRQG